ncbi:hypothetical protein FB451DRAFT_1364749 [Mycena latifolia]|nr:hypothetical protein FB451DRAFT_1364749 [Mycena latifolia]
MFNLIRRFSGSVIPRPDRPWEEDPTSNAPHTGRKRRMADEDRDDDDEEQARLKKVRAATVEAPDARESSATPLPQAKETADVKEVTQGVKEVELEEKPQTLPESVPLPEEEAGELDGEASSTASTPPPAGEPEETQDAVPEAEAASGDVVSEAPAADAQASVEPPKAVDEATDTPAATDADAPPIKQSRAVELLEPTET